MLGESVVVGKVTNDFGDGVEIQLPESDWHVPISLLAGWQFEQVVSVPSKFGAVIRRADGTKFLSFGVHDEWFENPDEITEIEDATEGGFSVLFDGVDE